MCFKKKEKIEKIDSLYKLRDVVGFRYKGELRRGTITKIEKGPNNVPLYEVTMGGECPAIFSNLKDENLIKLRK